MLLKQSWVPQPAEGDDAPAPRAFDPASVEYTVRTFKHHADMITCRHTLLFVALLCAQHTYMWLTAATRWAEPASSFTGHCLFCTHWQCFTSACVQELPKRLAKTKALQDVNRLKLALKGKELDLHAVNSRKKAPEEEKEARFHSLLTCVDGCYDGFFYCSCWQRATRPCGSQRLRCCWQRWCNCSSLALRFTAVFARSMLLLHVQILRPCMNVVQAAQAAFDEVKGQLDEAQAAFTELKASFADDPTALTAWMNALFATADMGLTSFTVGGPAWPYCAASSAFSAKDGSEATAGVERMLAAFRKRYALERGAGSTQARCSCSAA